MGGGGSNGCEFGVVDCVWGGTFGFVDLLGDCEEGLEGGFLDGGFGYAGIVWWYEIPFPPPRDKDMCMGLMVTD